MPGRQDNPRFFDCQLAYPDQPEQLRGYSFVVSEAQLDMRSVPQELARHGLLQQGWELVSGSLHEIELEQHYYLTWQRGQDATQPRQ